MFNKDKKTAPLMLLALVGCGILLPLGVMSWYMLKNDQFVGPNRIHNETLMFYLHSKFAVKESQVPGGRRGGGREAPVLVGGTGGGCERLALLRYKIEHCGAGEGGSPGGTASRHCLALLPLPRVYSHPDVFHTYPCTPATCHSLPLP
jgi:hypothetical protein